MRNILDLLRRKAPAKSAEIRRALAELAPDGAAAAHIAVLNGKRRAALLDGLAGADVEAIENEIANAVRERDRANVFREELTVRLETAESLEALDALSERKIKAEVDGRDIVKRFQRYSQLLAELAAMLRDEQTHRNECDAIDAQLDGIGSTDRVQRADRPNFGLSEALVLRAADNLT